MGLVKLTDAETGDERWIDTSNKRIRSMLKQQREEVVKKRKSLFVSSRLDSIEIQTGQNYITPLVQFFRRREKRW